MCRAAQTFSAARCLREAQASHGGSGSGRPVDDGDELIELLGSVKKGLDLVPGAGRRLRVLCIL